MAAGGLRTESLLLLRLRQVQNVMYLLWFENYIPHDRIIPAHLYCISIIRSERQAQELVICRRHRVDILQNPSRLTK